MLKKYGPNYEFGVKDGPARIAIQMAHRIGFVVVTIYFAWLIYKLTRNRELMPLGISLLVLLLIQIGLGVINVTQNLPLLAATLHNGVAALLLVNMVLLLYKTRSHKPMSQFKQYLELTKPKVVLLILFTAFVGHVVVDAQFSPV